jgi:hypothetical protein
MRRSKLAEIYAAKVASAPLIAENVFLSPKYLHGEKEREVCDLLVVLRDQALVVQMKSQDKPRTGEKLTRWVEKETRKAGSQIKGAVRTLRERTIWCQHPRRGRVEFKAGQLRPLQALAIVETHASVPIPKGLPKVCDEVPISYVSLNDFLNLVRELRAFPEIAMYLAQRAAFAEGAQIPLGGERTVYVRYVLNEGGFGGCRSYDQMAQSMMEFSVGELLAEKQAADRPAYVVEHFVDSLAARIARWDEGLTPELIRAFDASEARRNYLRIQEEFCELRLCDRRALGRQLLEARSMLDTAQSKDMAYASARSDNKLDMLYVVAASRGIRRAELLTRAYSLLVGGLAFYKKRAGVVVVDRDGEGFEFILIQKFQPLAEHWTLAECFFGKLRTFSYIGSVAPGVVKAQDRELR